MAQLENRSFKYGTKPSLVSLALVSHIILSLKLYQGPISEYFDGQGCENQKMTFS